MAVVKVTEHSFRDEETGKVTPYERLSIMGYVSGEVHTLELKLSKAEILLAKMLLNSKENKPQQNARSANSDERQSFNDQIEKRKSEPNMLNEEDQPPQDWFNN